MRPEEIRNLTSAEVGQKLDETYEELFNLRFQKHTGQLKNFARMGATAPRSRPFEDHSTRARAGRVAG